MNDKNQQIRKMLEAGMSYSQIQMELKVSPTRISMVKSAMPKGKRPNSIGIHPGNSSENSRRSTFSDQNMDNFDSETPEKIVKHNYLHESDKQYYLEELKLEKKRLENEEISNRIRESELKLQEEQMQIQKQEAEKPWKLLLFRLKSLIEGYEITKLQFYEVINKLNEAKSLENDYRAIFFTENKKFEGTVVASSLADLINLFEKIKKNLQSNPLKSIDFVCKIDMLLIKQQCTVLGK